MFGMGASEILVILVIALLFLGPEKLPEAAQKLSRGIRDLRSQTRELQHSLENDNELGGAIRDLKSALRGDEPRPRPRPAPPLGKAAADGGATPAAAGLAAGAADPPSADAGAAHVPPHPGAADADAPPEHAPPAGPRLPASAGEAEPAASDGGDAEHDDLDVASLVRPAAGTVAKGEAAPAAGDGESPSRTG